MYAHRLLAAALVAVLTGCVSPPPGSPTTRRGLSHWRDLLQPSSDQDSLTYSWGTDLLGSYLPLGYEARCSRTARQAFLSDDELRVTLTSDHDFDVSLLEHCGDGYDPSARRRLWTEYITESRFGIVETSSRSQAEGLPGGMGIPGKQETKDASNPVPITLALETESFRLEVRMSATTTSGIVDRSVTADPLDQEVELSIHFGQEINLLSGSGVLVQRTLVGPDLDLDSQQTFLASDTYWGRQLATEASVHHGFEGDVEVQTLAGEYDDIARFKDADSPRWEVTLTTLVP